MSVPPSVPDEFPPEKIVLPRGAAWGLTMLFLLMLAVPPLVFDRPVERARELGTAVGGKGSTLPAGERLRVFDHAVASAPFTTAPRAWTQQFLTMALGRGNDRVVPGRGGWLFYRQEIQALTGYGPMRPEPHSVSRDPALLDWQPPLKPVLEFAASLRERGVELWLLPVPMKPSLYPEMLTGERTEKPVRHADTERFFTALREGGIRVLDPAERLFAAKARDAAEGPVYLPEDTHWTTRGMRLTAEWVADRIGAESWFAALPAREKWPAPEQVRSALSHGDLAGKLGLAEPDRLAPPSTELLPVVNPPPGARQQEDGMVDRNSPVVLLGDSFVNIFDDPGLGFPHPDGRPRTQAGFAWNLAALLNMRLDVHAVNGGGASDVRRWLARRGDSVVRSKKLVLWVIAERDLMLSRSVAKASRVVWEHTPIAADPVPVSGAGPVAGGAPDGDGSPTPADDGTPVVVEAVVMEKSEAADPRQANYDNALCTVRWRISREVSGKKTPEESFEVVHWYFKKRQLQPSSRLETGRTYRLKLERWAARTDLHPISRLELEDAEPVWFCETPEPVP